MMNKVFGFLPYKVMWKFENPVLPGKLNNVFISIWFPEPHRFAHPGVKLFLSHGGLLSTTESVYHVKPMLGLPVLYDQHMNIKKGIQAGFALGLDFHNLARDDFKSGILVMMNNPRYINSARITSNIYHDQPVKPLELALYWTEYVLRHKGAVHLQNAAQKMSFIQKHSIDTVGVLLAAAMFCVILLIFAVCKIIKFVSGKVSLHKEKTN